MGQIHVVYHHEGDTWWAESDELPGFSAVDEQFGEVRRMLQEAVSFLAIGDAILVESLDGVMITTDDEAQVDGLIMNYRSTAQTVGSAAPLGRMHRVRSAGSLVSV